MAYMTPSPPVALVSEPSRWTTFLVPIAINLLVLGGGGLVAMSARDADLRHLQTRAEANAERIKALEVRANEKDVAVEGIRRDVAHIREGVDDMKAMLRGNFAKR